jgi:hypothetical protein
MVASRQNVGRNYFQNVNGDAENARIRAARAGIAGSPTMRALPTTLETPPSAQRQQPQPQPPASTESVASNASSMSELTGAFGEKLNWEDDENMDGTGMKKLKKGSPAMKAHMARLRAMRKQK